MKPPAPSGPFILGPARSVAQILDGTSVTAAVAEQLPGIAGPYTQTFASPAPQPTARAFARVAVGPLTDDACAASAPGWLLNKGRHGGTATISTPSTIIARPPTPHAPIVSLITTPVGRPRGASTLAA